MINRQPYRFQKDMFSGWQAIGVVIGMLALWALVLCFGIWANGQTASLTDPRFRKLLVILGSISVFGFFWLVLLLNRKRRSDWSGSESDSDGA